MQTPLRSNSPYLPRKHAYAHGWSVLHAKTSALLNQYRSFLIDQAVAHFNEWWLVGSTYTAHWAPAGEVTVGDSNNLDIINHFVAEGLGGGIVKLGLFIAMIGFSFKGVGSWTARHNFVPRIDRTLVWAFGACLLGHCISFMSVSYFDQIIVIWYWLLAVMAVISLGPVEQVEPTTAEAPAQNFAGRIFPQPNRRPPGFQM